MVTRFAGKLHLLTVREVQTAGEGDLADGGGLLLRVRGTSCSWVFRYTSPSGRRREMGLGIAHRASAAQAGHSLTGARDLAHKARDQLRQDTDPIEAREGTRAAKQAQESAKRVKAQRERWTLARCARDYHEREVEPSTTAKHCCFVALLRTFDSIQKRHKYRKFLDIFFKEGNIPGLQPLLAHEFRCMVKESFPFCSCSS